MSCLAGSHPKATSSGISKNNFNFTCHRNTCKFLVHNTYIIIQEEQGFPKGRTIWKKEIV
mgnify:CR=1 FL=1